MSLTSPFCTKCTNKVRTANKKDEHTLQSCQKPWPFWEDQFCDRCGSPEHETGDSKKCPKKQPLMSVCNKCGHEGHHMSKNCPISDKTKKEHVEQYTKTRYEAVMLEQSRAEERGASKKNPPVGALDGPSRTIPVRSQGTPNRAASSGPSQASPGSKNTQSSHTSGTSAANIAQASSSATQSQQNVPDPTDEVETTLRITVNSTAKRKALEQKELDRLRWSKVDFDEVLDNPARTIARGVTIQTNFLAFNFATTNVALHKYRIQLGTITRGNNTQTITKPEVRRALIKRLLHRQRPPAGDFVTDYLDFVISVGPLYPQFTSQVPCAYNVPHLRSTPAGQGPATLNTIFWFEGTIDRDRLLNYFGYRHNLTPANLGTYHPDQDIRNLNVLSWYHINNDDTFRGGRTGKKFYAGNFGPPGLAPNGGDGRNLNNLYIVHRGCFSSVRPGRDSLLLNINPATTAFFPTIHLQVWIDRRWANAQHLPLPHSVDWKELKDVRVTFDGHQPDANGRRKPRTICSFLFNTVQPPRFQPKDNNGNLLPFTTVLAYLRRRYNWLTFNDNPCWVNCGSIAVPNWFPASHLTIVEWQKVKGQVATTATANMLTMAQTHASQNKRYIFTASEALGLVPPANWQFPGPGYQATHRVPAPDPVPRLTSRLSATVGPLSWPPFYNTFGLEPLWGLLRIQARYLALPVLAFKRVNNNLDQTLQLSTAGATGRKASWNLAGRHFFIRPTAAFRLCVLRVGVNVENCLTAFREQLDTYLNGCRLRTHRDPLDWHIAANANHRANFVTALTAAHNWFLTTSRQDNTGDPPLIILVLGGRGDPRTYAYLKWWGDCLRGIPTICVTRDAINSQFRNGIMDRGFLGNLSLKINFKLGGTSHALANNRQWYGAKPYTMIVGADVTHPGRTANPTYPSMAGVVATRDATSAHYLGSARLQAKNTEHIVQLDEMIEERICVYFQHQHQLPQHILFYRDGVSESQFGMVKDDELPLIKAGCFNAGIRCNGPPNWSPFITLLVVGKRHHTRFYPIEPGAPLTLTANLPSGLVVDRTVTSHWKADFYLQSHDSALGTAKSAHYMIITNESGYHMDEIQELTNKLCYTGQRATKALSVCTPARYADILCDRLRCYVKDVISHQAPATGMQPTTLIQYNQDPLSWRANAAQPAGGPINVAANQGFVAPARVNPWHPNVDEIMFYL